LPKDYYLYKLYPLQDDTLKIISGTPNDFYLSGGTALGRFYLHHRFSDDLDFFLNQSADFTHQVEQIFQSLKLNQIQFSVGIKSTDFVRISLRKEQVILKVEFVNDVAYHYGDLKIFPLFPRVDNWRNILSNKLTALERREPKDIADILFLARHYSFHWNDIFNAGLQKVVYLDALDVSKILAEFPVEYFQYISWDNEPDQPAAARDLQQIAKDILLKQNNSIYGNSHDPNKKPRK